MSIDEEIRADPILYGNAMKLCASHIKEILYPNGKQAEGNIAIHCAGGMRRTGVLVGIIRRFVGEDSLEEIIEDYKSHVIWGPEDELNVRFITGFDLDLLEQKDDFGNDPSRIEEKLGEEDDVPLKSLPFVKKSKLRRSALKRFI